MSSNANTAEFANPPFFWDTLYFVLYFINILVNDARFPKPYQPEWLWYLASCFEKHEPYEIKKSRDDILTLSENRDFSGTEPPLDLRPVCKFKFVHCGPVEKNQSDLSFSV